MKRRIQMLARFNRKTAAVLSGVTASLLFAASASAAQQSRVVVYGGSENTRTEHVSYTDLDLTNDKHQKRLNLRVTGAVKRVCLYENSHGLQDTGYYHCADDAWSSAKPQIAQAVQRATDIALTGHSSIAATAISINLSSR
jgi:UrcA family protein